MAKITLLQNQIQEYAWGSHTAIATLLGHPSPSPSPQAELWMGAHPKAPSQGVFEGKPGTLLEHIKAHPATSLGVSTAQRFENKLPFLFKVLAAESPLSIQSHPNLAQAREGFARENERGIPITARHRNYRDANHKPELICALTPFWALRGFRAIPECLQWFAKLTIPGLQDELERFQANPDRKGLQHFFEALMNYDTTQHASFVQQAMQSIPSNEQDHPVFVWMHKLNESYPGDVGVLCPILLNLIQLEPGQAMYLPAGELHAYLEGTGIELMANSDNVLRGGLTPKHIDVPELLKTLTFATGPIQLTPPTPRGPVESAYETPAPEFELSILRFHNQTYTSSHERSAEILFCTKGEIVLQSPQEGEPHVLTQGKAVFVPATRSLYTLQGVGTLYKATTPL